MNHRRFMLLGLLLVQVVNLFSQSISYTYDANGNRLTRTLFVQKLQSNSVTFPVYNPKTLKPVEYSKGSSEVPRVTKRSLMDENIKSESDKVSMVVYPNPNKGIIKVEISNLPLQSSSELRFYDLSGHQIVSKQNIENYTEFDITNYKDGIYILRVRIDGKIYDWKVIKNLTNNN